MTSFDIRGVLSSRVLLALLCVIAGGCANRPEPPSAPPKSWAALSVDTGSGAPLDVTGLTNVLDARLGAGFAESSSFFPPPNDPAVLLDPDGTDYAAAQNTAMPQFLVYNLGLPRTLKGAAILWYNQDNRGVDYTLQGRRDPNGSWIALASCRGNHEMRWETSIKPQEVTQVRLEVTKAAGQGRTLIRQFRLYSPDAKRVENVALTSKGLKIGQSSTFAPAPNGPAAMFTGEIGAALSPDYAAGATDGLPDQVTFSLPTPREIRAVSVHWYDDQNYASQWELAVQQGSAWRPILSLKDQKSVQGFYLLSKPPTGRTFRLTVQSTVGQQRLLARQLALYAYAK